MTHRESRIDSLVQSGMLPASITFDDPDTGKYYSGASNSARTASSNASTASDVNALSSTLSGLFDRIGSVSAQNSALSAQYAREQRDWSANQAAIARDFNAAEAAKNRDWQQMMSNTAHQREVADLKAAGLNPILSALNGNGAAVTSGATANATMPSGDKGEVDTSANASIVGLLSSFLSAQTQLQAADISARTQEAVADKYTSMQQLVAEMTSATSRYNAELSSWTSLTNSERQAAVSKYAAELQSAANRYGAELSYSAATQIARNELEWRSQHPSSMWQGLGSVLGELGINFGNGTAVSSARDIVDKAVDHAQSAGRKLTEWLKDHAGVPSSNW